MTQWRTFLLLLLVLASVRRGGDQAGGVAGEPTRVAVGVVVWRRLVRMGVGTEASLRYNGLNNLYLGGLGEAKE